MLKAFSAFVVIVLLNSCSQSTPSLNKKIINPQISATQLDYSFIQDLNQLRAKGTACSSPTTPLHFNSYLKKAAMAHAKDMAFNNFLEHDGSGDSLDVAKNKDIRQSSFIERILFFGYEAKPYNLLGEVVTKTKFKKDKKSDTKAHFQRALKAFINDPDHCKVLMNPRFKDVGVGYYKAKDGYYWVIDLGEKNARR